jgi:4-amino-4-deoxy-L-arabinose transferase-like glycosyltransferase
VLRCTAVRIPLALYSLALLVRGLLFAAFPNAAYPDSYYYVSVARSLASGHGFSLDYIWSFVDVGGRIPADPVLPIASNAHWMPLGSLVQVPFIWLLGPTPLASALPFMLIGALAAPLTWALAREVGAGDRVALASGIALCVPAAVAILMVQPDNFALFQVLGMGALWATARGLRGSGRAFALVGLLVGLAALSRPDGVLLGVGAALLFFWDRWRAHRSGGRRAAAIGWRWAFACAGLFLLVMAPWLARQMVVFGSLSPSSSTGRILWIQTYEQMWSVTGQVSPATFLDQGLGSLLASRVMGLVSAAGIFIVLICSTSARSSSTSCSCLPRPRCCSPSTSPAE